MLIRYKNAISFDSNMDTDQIRRIIVKAHSDFYVSVKNVTDRFTELFSKSRKSFIDRWDVEVSPEEYNVVGDLKLDDIAKTFKGL